MRYILFLLALISFGAVAADECISKEQHEKALQDAESRTKALLQRELKYKVSIDHIRKLLMIRYYSEETAGSRVIDAIDGEIDTEFGNLHIAIQTMSDDKKARSLVKRTIATANKFYKEKPASIEMSFFNDIRKAI